MVRRMQTGMLIITDSKGTVSHYAVASMSELVAVVDGVAFRFHTPEYPPPSRVPVEKNIDKLEIAEILDHLKTRVEWMKEYED